MASPIAELLVVVGADVAGAIAGLKQTGAAVDSLAGQFIAARPAALLFEAAAAGVGAGLGASVKVAADFEAQMAGVRSVLSPTEVQQFGDALDKLALTLGRDTTFTSREAASAIEELIKAGLPAEAVLNGAAAAALNLAAATGVSTSDAATIAAQALNTFNISARDSTAVVDKLAGVANTSASDISFLRFGLASVGGVAAGIGLTFNDTADALGLLSKSFAGGSDAGTSLKTFLERLQPQTKQQREEFAKLGITTAEGGNAFFDAAGHVQSLANIAEVLHGSLSGMTDQQRQAALQTLFGTDAIRAALALYSAGSDGVLRFADASGQQGIAAQSAKTRLDSLEGTMNNLGGSIETVQIIVGKIFLPTLRSIAETVKTLVDAFGNLSPETQRLVVFITGGAAAVAGLLAGFVLLAPFIAPLIASFAALGGVLLAMALPIAIIGAAAFGLFQVWQTNFGGIRDVVLNTFDRIRPILDNFRLVFEKALGGDLAGALDTFRAIIGGLSPELGGFITRTIETMQALGNIIATEVAPRLGEVLAGAMRAAVTAGEALQTFWNTQLGPAAEAIGNFIAQNVGPAFDLLATAFGNIRSAGEGVLAFMTPLAEQFGAFAGEKGTALVKFFRDDLPPALAALGVQVQSLGPLFGTLGEFFGAVTNLMTTLAGIGGTALRGLFENVLVPGFQKLAEALGPIQPTLDATGQAIQSMASGFTTIGAALEPVRTFFADLNKTLNDLAVTLAKPELAPIFTPGSGARLPGLEGPTGGGPNQALQAAAGSAALGASPAGPLVNIGSLIISSEAEGRKFIQDMAAAVAAAAGRVSAPPDNSGFPALAPAP